MKKGLMAVSAGVIVGALFMSGCLAPGGSGKAGETAFTGEWTLIDENGISGDIERDTVSVVTDGKRFKIDGKYTVNVYDGASLKTKYKSQEGYGGFKTEESVSSREITEYQVSEYKFWAKSIGGKAGSGGQIAGRDTVLYQARSNRPDGEITTQCWVDSETDIVLKYIFTIYSKQISAIVTKNTKECISITYDPLIDDSMFDIGSE